MGRFFRMVAEDVIPEWSLERETGAKPFATEVPLGTKEWRPGYEWAAANT